MDRTFVAAIVATALLLSVASPPARASAGGADRLAVVFDAGTPARTQRHILADALGTAPPVPAVDAASKPVVAGPSVVGIPVPSARAAEVAARLRVSPDVATVERDAEVKASATTPNDPFWPAQWGARTVGADRIWDFTTGTDAVTVAVIDTGVDATHPDLVGRVIGGYDFVNGDTDADDDDGHGTAVASIIAGAGDNDVGMAGLCWRCRVLPLKALKAGGSGYVSDAAAAMVYAVDAGADIINLSLGAPDTSAALSAAVTHATVNGVLVIASAGNNADTAATYPAAEPGVLAVAAVDGNDHLSSFSNSGSWVDLAAPDCNPAAVAAGTGAGTVRAFCGTSSAAPMVSGIAALLRSDGRSVPTSDDVAAALVDTAVDVGGGVAHGRVDGYSAYTTLVSAARDAEGAPFSDAAGSVHETAIATIAAAGITDGCGSGRYCPGQPVTRGQMATFLTRALALPPAPPAAFPDVSASSPHAPSVAALVAAGVTTGCAADRYCPADPVTRAQMASFLARGLALPAGDTSFADVTTTSPHAPAIAALVEAEITDGCAPARFCPTEDVTRGQMATLLVRALRLPPA